MSIVVRPLRDEEGRIYLEIVNAAITGLAHSHYTPESIAGWVVPINDAAVAELMLNVESEIRVVAELAGIPVGIGALITGSCELRACYVLPSAARRGVGSAIVRHIEQLAIESGLSHLQLAASLNAEPFYAAQGYQVLERREVLLRNGYPLPAVWMRKQLKGA